MIQLNHQNATYAAERPVGVVEKGGSIFAMSTIRGRCTSLFVIGVPLNHEDWSMGKHRTTGEVSELRSL